MTLHLSFPSMYKSRYKNSFWNKLMGLAHRRLVSPCHSFFPFPSFSLSVLLSGWLLGTRELYWLSVFIKEDQALLSTLLSLSPKPSSWGYPWILLGLDPGRRGKRGYPFEFLSDRLFLLLRPWQAVSFTCGAFVGYVFLVSPDITLLRRTFIISSFHWCPLLAPATWGHRYGIRGLFSQLLKVCLCWCWDLPSFFFCCLYLLVISWLTIASYSAFPVFCGRAHRVFLHHAISAAFGSTWFNLESGIFSAYLLHWKWCLFLFPFIPLNGCWEPSGIIENQIFPSDGFNSLKTIPADLAVEKPMKNNAETQNRWIERTLQH